MIKTILVIVIATFIMSYVQFATLGGDYLSVNQVERHNAVLEGRAGNPWQYRLLPELIVEPFLWIFGIPTGFKVAFVVFVLGVWAALLFYYKSLGLSGDTGLLAIGVLGCAFAISGWDSSMPWSLLLELIFFALAGRMIMGINTTGGERHRHSGGACFQLPFVILPVVILATLNRETAVFIPLMFLVNDWRNKEVLKRTFYLCMCFAVVYGGLRAWFPPQHQLGWYGGIMPFTWEHLKLNATTMFGWVRLWCFLGVIPILAYFNIKKIVGPLQRWLIWIVPVWCAVNFCGAFIGEPNKYWTICAVFLLPAVLKGLQTKE